MTKILKDGFLRYTPQCVVWFESVCVFTLYFMWQFRWKKPFIFTSSQLRLCLKTKGSTENSEEKKYTIQVHFFIFSIFCLCYKEKCHKGEGGQTWQTWCSIYRELENLIHDFLILKGTVHIYIYYITCSLWRLKCIKQWTIVLKILNNQG